MNQYRPWTIKEVTFLKENYASMSTKDISDHLNRPVSGIVGKASALGISKGYFVTWTTDMEQYLRDNFLTRTQKEMAEALGLTESKVANKVFKLGLRLPAAELEKRKSAHRFKPGIVPANKGKKMSPEQYEKALPTMFKKGRTNHNEAKDGDIRIRLDHANRRGGTPYKWIRLAKGKWEMLHVNLWKKAHGPIPEGYIVVFKDGDSMNCELDNLEMITLAENMLRNSCSINLTDNYVARTIIGKGGDKETAQLLVEKAPDLIVLKRTQLLVNREIKNHATGKA